MLQATLIATLPNGAVNAAGSSYQCLETDEQPEPVVTMKDNYIRVSSKKITFSHGQEIVEVYELGDKLFRADGELFDPDGWRKIAEENVYVIALHKVDEDTMSSADFVGVWPETDRGTALTMSCWTSIRGAL